MHSVEAGFTMSARESNCRSCRAVLSGRLTFDWCYGCMLILTASDTGRTGAHTLGSGGLRCNQQWMMTLNIHDVINVTTSSSSSPDMVLPTTMCCSHTQQIAVFP